MGLRTTETEYDNIDTPEFWERRKAEMAEPMPQLDLTERILRRQSRLRDAHGEYREQLLAEIAEDGYRLLERRIQLTPVRKLWLAWRLRRREKQHYHPAKVTE